MKVTKQNKGITLIALVITIIVMLILVAVTINMAVNGGLFGYAGNAAGETKTAIEKEKRIGNLEDGLSTNELIEIFTREEIEEIHNWQRSEDNITCTCNECKKNNPAGRNLLIGERLDYVAGGRNSTTINAQKSGIAQGLLDGKHWLESLETQTISKDEITRWVVLGIEDRNNNGTNETLLLTMEQPTTGKIALYGAAGYNYWIEESDRIAKTLYGENARGITFEDLKECLQFPNSPNLHLLSADTNWNTIKTNGTKTPKEGEADTEENLGKYVVNACSYFITGPYGSNRAKWLACGNNREYEYWLSNIGVGVSYSDRADFGPGEVRKRICF